MDNREQFESVLQSPAPWVEAEQPASPASYKIDADGVWFESKNGELTRISGPAWVTAKTLNQARKNWGRVVKWLDSDNMLHSETFPQKRFHEPGSELAQDLASGGLDIEPGQEKRLILYLGRYKPEARLTNVDRLGWIDTTDDQLAFVTPNETLSQSDMEYVFQRERHCPTVSTMRSNGTLKDWKENVAEKCKEKPYLIFSLCLGLSGPLMKPASIDNGGFHLYAQSSQGKTLCAQLSASAWGCGADPAVAPELSYIRRWNSTVNAFEGLAAAHSDNILVLDELGTCSSRDFGGVIYNLASGLGRAAMDRNRNLKAQRIWRNMLLSTGEVSSRSKIEEESVKTSAKAGQLVRLLDIPVSGIVGDEKDPKAFVDQLELACGQYYGSAGPEFVRQLTAVFESATELRDAVSEFIGASMTRLGASKLRPALERAAKKFALVEVAGRLGVMAEILPFTDEEIKSSVRTAYDAWLTEAEAIPDDIRAVLAVRGFILKHRESRFRHQPIRENEPKTIDLCGYFHRTDNFYLFTPAGFKEACTGVDPKQVAKKLDELGLLHRNEKDRYQSKHHIGEIDQTIRFYAVRADILSADLSQ